MRSKKKCFVRNDWIIHASSLGGWDAWNCRTRERVELVHVGYSGGVAIPDAFSRAVAVFEQRIGPYYGTGKKGGD